MKLSAIYSFLLDKAYFLAIIDNHHYLHRCTIINPDIFLIWPLMLQIGWILSTVSIYFIKLRSLSYNLPTVPWGIMFMHITEHPKPKANWNRHEWITNSHFYFNFNRITTRSKYKEIGNRRLEKYKQLKDNNVK